MTTNRPRVIETKYRPMVPILAIDPPAGGAISSKTGDGKRWLEETPPPKKGMFGWGEEIITKVSSKSGGGVFFLNLEGKLTLYTSASPIHKFCDETYQLVRKQIGRGLPLILLEDGIPQNNKLMRSVGVISGYFYAMYGIEPVLFCPKKSRKYEAWSEWSRLYIGEETEIGAHEASAFNLFYKFIKAYEEREVEDAVRAGLKMIQEKGMQK